MSMESIYLDYMATTPVDPRVINKMVACLGPEGIFGNPASKNHNYGKQALAAVEAAREQVAAAIHALPQEVIFTSGATEANNLALLGAARFYQRKGRHALTLRTEHKSVLDSFQQLEREGFRVSYLSPQANGLVNLEELANSLTAETILVSIMHVNNEIGVVQDLAAIGGLLREKGIIFHVDAAQSAGKIAIDLRALEVDLMTFSAHKNYGPKGVGALYIRSQPKIRLQPLSFGGGHENGVRSGTLATHQIVGMGEAFALAESLREVEQAHILSLRQQLWEGIKDLPGIRLNGDQHLRVSGNLNLSFAGVEGDSLVFSLQDLALSTASACVSGSRHPSYVLGALGLNDELAYSSLRLSLGRYTTEQEVARAIEVIRKGVLHLHEISPL